MGEEVGCGSFLVLFGGSGAFLTGLGDGLRSDTLLDGMGGLVGGGFLGGGFLIFSSSCSCGVGGVLFGAGGEEPWFTVSKGLVSVTTEGGRGFLMTLA